MNKTFKQEFKDNFNEIKREVFDNQWNGFKALISMVLPIIGFFYLYKKWMLLIEPLMNEYSKKDISGLTQHDALLSLCLIIAYVAPIFLVFPTYEFGFRIGLLTKFFHDTKTRRLFWDQKDYFVRDMSEEDRNQITKILSKYKSKLQLKKERLETASWLKRNFS